MAKRTKENVAIETELTIPKHRFDCVNLCLQDTKSELKQAQEEVKRLKDNESILIDLLVVNAVEKILAESNCKNYKAAKSLMDFSKIQLQNNGKIIGVGEQVSELKINHSYLFEADKCKYFVLKEVQETALIDAIKEK
jgi:hypothetical protein